MYLLTCKIYVIYLFQYRSCTFCRIIHVLCQGGAKSVTTLLRTAFFFIRRDRARSGVKCHRIYLRRSKNQLTYNSRIADARVYKQEL